MRTRLLPKLKDSLLHEEYLNQMSFEQVAKLILQKYGKRKKSKAVRLHLHVYHTRLTNDRISWD